MSEYVKYGGREIWVGSCEDISEVRFEDRFKTQKVECSVDLCSDYGLRWRLPFPEEDFLQLGHYHTSAPYIKTTDRGYKMDSQIAEHAQMCFNDHFFDSLAERPGSVTLHTEFLGISVTMMCFHGIKINEGVENSVSFRWREAKPQLCLHSIKNEKEELKVCYMCAECGLIWSTPFHEIQPYIHSMIMKQRIFKLCFEYWEQKHKGEYYPHPYIHNGLSLYSSKEPQSNGRFYIPQETSKIWFEKLDDGFKFIDCANNVKQ